MADQIVSDEENYGHPTVGSSNNNNAYMQVPVEPPFTSPDLETDIETFSTESLGFTFENGMYHGVDNEVRDYSDLYRLVLSQKAAPTLYLKVTGYQKGTIAGDSGVGSALFSFTLPLPQLQHEQGILYTKANDCPSLRGSKGRSIQARNVKERLNSRLSTWNSTYSKDDDAQTWDSRLSSVRPAAEACLQHWNKRRRESLLPPWLRLKEEIENEELEFDHHQAVNNPTRPHPRQTLRDFCKQNSSQKLWSRWLIVPQIPYGWDLYMMEEEIYKMIPTEHLSSISHITAQIISPPPSFLLHLYSHRRIGQLYQTSFALEALSKFFFYLAMILSLLAFIGRSNNQTSAGSTLTFFAILSFAVVLTLWTLIGKESVDDTVGMAWALKRRIPLGLDSSHSREEAFAEARKKLPRMLYDSTAVQKHDNGWYYLLGVEEKDWLYARKEKIEQEIRRGMR